MTEVNINYLIIETGYRSRLDVSQVRLLHESDAILLCTKDVRWGTRCNKEYVEFHKMDAPVVNAIHAIHEKYNMDGTAVMKVKHNDVGCALYKYHQHFASDSEDGRYCGFFYGVPYSTLIIQDDVLGGVAMMLFDCESG